MSKREVSLLVGLREICDRTGVDKSTINRYIRKRIFPKPRKLGGKNVWLESDIESFMGSLPEQVIATAEKGWKRPGEPERDADGMITAQIVSSKHPKDDLVAKLFLKAFQALAEEARRSRAGQPKKRGKT